MSEPNKPAMFQPGRDGKHGQVPTSFGEHGPAAARATEAHAVPGNIARDGAGKQHRVVPIKSGMTDQQKMTAGIGGLGHPVYGAPDASSANPLDKEPLGKQFAPVKAVIGQRSRNGEVGPMAVGQAHANRKAYDPSLGGVLLSCATKTR